MCTQSNDQGRAFEYITLLTLGKEISRVRQVASNAIIHHVLTRKSVFLRTAVGVTGQAQSEVSNYTEMERFIEGFRLGARFMLDAFVMPDNSVIRDIT